MHMMDFKKIAAGVLFLFTLAGLVSCGNRQEFLSGAYRAEYYGTGMTYVFSEETVIAHFTVGGYEIGSCEGTYSLNDDRDQITITFALDELTQGAPIPAGLTSLGGTFSFQQGDDYIMIGQVRYARVEEDSVPSHTTSSDWLESAVWEAEKIAWSGSVCYD